MIILITFAVFGALFGALSLSDGGLTEALFGLVTGAACSAFVGFVLAMAVGTFAYNSTYWEQTSDVPLVSMADGSDTHGAFFLGSGIIDSAPAYTWYEQAAQNDYVRRSVDANEATIHYTSGRPHYTIKKEKPSGSFWQAWGWNMAAATGKQYDFYVPRGSITQSYRLDNR